MVLYLESIFLPFFLSSVYTLPSGTPQPVCPPSAAIHFSLLNYSSNVEVFIRSSVSQFVCVYVCAVLQHYYGWQQELCAWHGWENLHTITQTQGKKRQKANERGKEMGRNGEK